jgi:hypothetical protein
MNYQMHFDPYMGEHLKQRDEELLQEMEAQRLKERLQENRTPRVACGWPPWSREVGSLWV